MKICHEVDPRWRLKVLTPRMRTALRLIGRGAARNALKFHPGSIEALKNRALVVERDGLPVLTPAGRLELRKTAPPSSAKVQP